MKQRERLALERWLKDNVTNVWAPDWARRGIGRFLESRGEIKRLSRGSEFSLTVLGSLDVSDMFEVVYAAYAQLAAKAGKAFRAHIVYIPLDRPRTLPSRSSVIMPTHINAGFAMFSSGRILVYRKQDATKVMIHELIHLSGLDRPKKLAVMVDDAEQKAWALEKHGFKTGPPVDRIAIDEAATETMACHMYAEIAKYPRRALSASIRDAADRLRRRNLVDGTHAFAYVIARDLLWDHATGRPCEEFMKLFDVYGGCHRRLMALIDARAANL
eukprot:366405-Chlamydomonas_euryale.AAC.6